MQPQLILKGTFCLLLTFEETEAQVAVCCFGSEAELSFYPGCQGLILAPAFQSWFLPLGVLIVQQIDGDGS